jgi:hypothetical protein
VANCKKVLGITGTDIADKLQDWLITNGTLRTSALATTVPITAVQWLLTETQEAMLVVGGIAETPSLDVIADAQQLQDFLVLHAIPRVHTEDLKSILYRAVQHLLEMIEDSYMAVCTTPSYAQLQRLYHETAMPAILDAPTVTAMRGYTQELVAMSNTTGQYLHVFGTNVLSAADQLLAAFKAPPTPDIDAYIDQAMAMSPSSFPYLMEEDSFDKLLAAVPAGSTDQLLFESHLPTIASSPRMVDVLYRMATTPDCLAELLRRSL